MPKIVAAVADHDDESSDISGYKEISGYLVFHVKLGENFQSKVRFAADGHKTDTPSFLTYSTVVSMDSVIICLTITDLKNLDILASEIKNVYITAPCR